MRKHHFKVFFLSFGFVLYFSSLSFGENYCLCYKELLAGVETTVTTCRQSMQQCKKLSDKVQKQGSKQMIKGSVSHECSWALRIEHLGSKEAWKTSSVSGGSWYTQGCLLQ
jgi:hypothetical protein